MPLFAHSLTICLSLKSLFFDYLGSTPEDEASKATDSVTFMVPKKEISMVPDMGKWKRSMVKLNTFHMFTSRKLNQDQV